MNSCTAFSSRSVKNIIIRCLSGTIRIKTNGNASDIFDDLTLHKMANAMTWINVKMCIFHVGTRRTNANDG